MSLWSSQRVNLQVGWTKKIFCLINQEKLGLFKQSRGIKNL